MSAAAVDGNITEVADRVTNLRARLGNRELGILMIVLPLCGKSIVLPLCGKSTSSLFLIGLAFFSVVLSFPLYLPLLPFFVAIVMHHSSRPKPARHIREGAPARQGGFICFVLCRGVVRLLLVCFMSHGWSPCVFFFVSFCIAFTTDVLL